MFHYINRKKGKFPLGKKKPNKQTKWEVTLHNRYFFLNLPDANVTFNLPERPSQVTESKYSGENRSFLMQINESTPRNNGKHLSTVTSAVTHRNPTISNFEQLPVISNLELEEVPIRDAYEGNSFLVMTLQVPEY